MKHPTPEQWMDYIYGELPKSQRADLAAHLKSCPSCAAQVARWGAVQSRLDDWQLPETTKRSWRIPAPAKWAIAAAFMIAAVGLGFGAGRAANTKALRQEMQIALQQAQNDNRLLLSAMQRLDAARQAEILALRKDLETVAVNADESFKEQQQLIQLAAYSQSNPQADTK
ncbi:MAG TPA: zf-HC2 domain-containing protein [Verrucomicrobiae bacterium]|nr:zf-HC2 domain-containing protein [Verrucomicrobiae bacterium]